MLPSSCCINYAFTRLVIFSTRPSGHYANQTSKLATDLSVEVLILLSVALRLDDEVLWTDFVDDELFLEDGLVEEGSFRADEPFFEDEPDDLVPSGWRWLRRRRRRWVTTRFGTVRRTVRSLGRWRWAASLPSATAAFGFFRLRHDDYFVSFDVLVELIFYDIYWIANNGRCKT